MSDRSTRFSGLSAWISFVQVLVPLSAIVLAIAAVVGHPEWTGWQRAEVAAGVVLVVGVAEALLASIGVILKIESTMFRTHDLVMDMRDTATKQTKQLAEVAEQSRLSDLARAISSREQERDLIRRAFNESLIGGDFEAAYYLADTLENRHGYKQEAEKLRRELSAMRRTSEEQYIAESVDRVNQLVGDHEWEKARVEAERLVKLYPAMDEIQRLPEALRQRRTEHKRRLLKAWDESVQRNEIDRGIALLRELDQYLTPNEAAALEESARGVFRAKLHNMGVQFSLAVTEKNWGTALQIGQDIVSEFPNTRMAAEVLEHLDTLKSRAARSMEAAVEG